MDVGILWAEMIFLLSDNSLIRDVSASKLCILKDPREQEILKICSAYLQHQPICVSDLVLLCRSKGVETTEEQIWLVLWNKSNLYMRYRPRDQSFVWDGTTVDSKSWLWEVHGIKQI